MKSKPTKKIFPLTPMPIKNPLTPMPVGLRLSTIKLMAQDDTNPVVQYLAQKVVELDEQLSAKWIPSSERLPDIGLLCAVIDIEYDNSVCIGKRYRTARGIEGWTITTVDEDDSVSDKYRNTITHWMPLPEAK